MSAFLRIGRHLAVKHAKSGLRPAIPRDSPREFGDPSATGQFCRGAVAGAAADTIVAQLARGPADERSRLPIAKISSLSTGPESFDYVRSAVTFLELASRAEEVRRSISEAGGDSQ